MIRIFLVLIFLSSCNYISYAQVIPMIKVATIGAEKEIITVDNFLNAEYSFMQVRIGRSANANLTLATIKNGIYEWVSSSGEKIYTFNGKIIKTSGIGKDMNHITYSAFALKEEAVDILDVELYGPHAVVQQELNVVRVGEENINYLDAPRTAIHFKELITTQEFRWKYANEYWMDPTSGRILRSSQVIHPDFPRLEIYYYYK